MSASRGLPLFIAFVILLNSVQNTQSLASNAQSPRTYNYFAFGSNMALATMESLRKLSPLASTAAVLPNHRLAFNVPGMPLVEPSAASVEPVDMEGKTGTSGHDNTQLVHGVLYKLTEEDFVTVCQTEGVPLAYTLHRCRPIPYVGDGKTAGWDAYQKALSNQNDEKNAGSVPAYTLRAGRAQWRKSKDIPPSSSYLGVLIRGAKEFRIDEDYVRTLENIPVGRTLVGGGVAGAMLERAEKSSRR